MFEIISPYAQDESKIMKEELQKARSEVALGSEYKRQLNERSELIFQLQSQIEILKETALVTEPGTAGNGAGKSRDTVVTSRDTMVTSFFVTCYNERSRFLKFLRYKLKSGI